MGRRFSQIPIAFDQLVNTLFGGWADETISSAAWRKRNEGNGWRVFALRNRLYFFLAT